MPEGDATARARVWALLDGLALPDQPAEEHPALAAVAARKADGGPAQDPQTASRDILMHMKALVSRLPREGGPLELSEAGAAYLEQLGVQGQQAATAVRNAAKSRLAEGGEAAAWLGWIEDCDDGPRCRFAETLAMVLIDRLKSKVEYENKKAPAVYSWTHHDWRGLRPKGSTLDEDLGGGCAVLRNGFSTLALFSVDTRTVLPRLRRAIQDSLGASLALECVVRGLARGVHYRAIDGFNPCTRLVFDGVVDFSHSVGIVSGRDQAKVLDLLEMLQAWRGNRRDIPPMLTYWLRSPCKGRPAQLRIDVGEALAPGYVDGGKVAPAWATRQERFLIPVLDLPDLDFVGNRNKANLAAFQWELLLVMRERIEEYPSGFVFTDIELEQARDASRVKREDASRAMEVWSTGSRAWLICRGEGLVLRDRAADQLYRRAAKKVLTGRQGGLRSSARRTRHGKMAW